MEGYLKIIKALADETRLRIINLLYERELCVCDIEDIVGASQTKVSRHLACLKNAGLIRDRKSAQWSFYSLIKTDDKKFVDELVFGALRNQDVCAGDLKRLREKEEFGACHQVNLNKGRTL